MRDSTIPYPDELGQSAALLAPVQQNDDIQAPRSSAREQQLKIALMLSAVCCTLFIIYSATIGNHSLAYFIISIPIVACSISITAAFYFMLKEAKYIHLALLGAGLLIAALQS